MNKKLFIILLLMLGTNLLNAQVFKPNYLGDDVQSYKGVLLKLKKDAISGFGHTFYESIDRVQKLYDDRVIYPDTKYNFNTVIDSLRDRVFLVENIIDKTGATYNSDDFLSKPIFILQDTVTKQRIYYKYDTKYEHNFPFDTSPIKLDPGKLCSLIEKSVDDFTDEIKFNTPMISNGRLTPIRLYKYILKGKTTYYLSLSTIGSTVNVGESGVILLFSDGTKMTKAVKVDVDANKDGFEYSAFFLLSQTELATLSSKKVKKFRLYIYDEEINETEADKFKIYVSCLRSTK